jgi:predicted NUDIX family phosphoesterase
VHATGWLDGADVGGVPDEAVLVVPREALMGTPGWRGVLSRGAEPYLAVIEREGRFAPRAAMESDPRFKQVIPYLVLRDRGRFFLMRRTRAGVDARLHERFSIGVGGHLNPGDADLAGGLAREWTEELEAGFVPEFRLLGLLNDDESDVGRVHVGVVFVAEADGRPVAVRETEKLEGRFAQPVELLAVHDRMETWSQLVFDFLSGRSAGVRGDAPGAGDAPGGGDGVAGRF